MKRNRTFFAVLGVLSVAFWSSAAIAETSSTDWKSELAADKAQIKSQKDEMKENSQASKDAEKALLGQIHQAQQEGDTATVKSLREQLTAMHQGNVAERKQDKEALQSARQEMKTDINAAKADRTGADRDNNPPGPAGGPGTNWENKPGPQGGPGASPNRRGGKK